MFGGPKIPRWLLVRGINQMEQFHPDSTGFMPRASFLDLGARLFHVLYLIMTLLFCLQLPESFHVEKGLWRLNTEIVKEQNFKEQFVEKYRGWQSLKPAFPNALVWVGQVKSLIKQFAIRYCVERAHQRRFKFHSLCNRARDGSSSDLHALGVFLDEKLHGARVRARIQFVEADEKPTIRFYRDDTKSVVDRRIRAVCHPGGVVVESPQAVLGVFGSFFSNLYSRAAVSEDLQEDLLSGIDKAPLRVKMIAWARISPLVSSGQR
ncbi:reverse transcriptase [Apostichopus japonicus]|uniref:Reverse transcriptase n=1 Tax=Stichopus japonicus TaxID=307972 RepID=A0A2G8KEM7_STIJA|nr:reverse transcriptase [Apostichopus japonicus]